MYRIVWHLTKEVVLVHMTILQIFKSGMSYLKSFTFDIYILYTLIRTAAAV
jgi:hypothetical protein